MAKGFRGVGGGACGGTSLAREVKGKTSVGRCGRVRDREGRYKSIRRSGHFVVAVGGVEATESAPVSAYPEPVIYLEKFDSGFVRPTGNSEIQCQRRTGFGAARTTYTPFVRKEELLRIESEEFYSAFESCDLRSLEYLLAVTKLGRKLVFKVLEYQDLARKEGSAAEEFPGARSTACGRTGHEGFKIARKPSREVRRAGRAAEIGGAVAMQRAGTAGGPGPLGLQGPPRSVKISPVNIQDEPGDPTSQRSLSDTSIIAFIEYLTT
ncbi:hypothetical protein KM043_015700 [Ampulex compressa]|nr:hypothetical protein KM043_015700 [Ampulex compressa]